MISHEFKSKISQICDTVLFDEDMASHTSFKVGGPAKVVAVPSDEKQLANVITLCKDIRYVLIGNGSNVVFSDEGYDGVVILTHGMNRCEIIKKEDDEVFVLADAGTTLSALASFAKTNALTGLEFACGIPGSVGGAVFMNAGAYGGEISDVIYSVKCLGDEEYVLSEKSDFSYRYSKYMDSKDVILSAVFKLKTGDSEKITALMKENLAKRKEKQPLEYPNAGSVFKRPEGYFAGKLIEDAGLKGYTVGGAQVSEKHAGFIINIGGATAKDIKNLVAYIKNTVKNRFGVDLECEIRFID
ncbi:MAG: UDP-N-acetylmuramate dehydrogenase [Clostridia bacterium]|nr:UDP-N-acetylmuramate dehydrogenase [Clostridia bacterium]